MALNIGDLDLETVFLSIDGPVFFLRCARCEWTESLGPDDEHPLSLVFRIALDHTAKHAAGGET